MTNTEKVETIEIAGISVEILRKTIKNLHIGVYPPDGLVRVAAPPSLGSEAIHHAVLMRLAWIKRKQAEFRKQARESERHFVSGETHYLFGRPCRLEVQAKGGRAGVSLAASDRIVMTCSSEADTEARAALMARWYRRLLREKSAPRVEKWAGRLGMEAPAWSIRRMKTKWGSCNPQDRRIWLNLELAKKPLVCLDYVILHEMAHFVSPRHDAAFLSTLDLHMPAWRQVRKDLNALPLAHEASFEGPSRS